MAIVSGGELILSDRVGGGGIWNEWYPASAGVDLSRLFATYGALYKNQLHVYTLIRKRALATRRLPLKVYERSDDGRTEQRDSDYARLLRQPNTSHSGQFLWEWTSSTFDLYGEAFWLKIRGRDGQPAELWPVHPSNMTVKRDENGTVTYVYTLGGFVPSTDPRFSWSADEIVHFKSYNPDTSLRGMSACEPLRQTLLNEDAIRRASSALWSNGARPAAYITSPKKLSDGAIARLRSDWDKIHTGVDNFGRTAILEEGMEPHVLSLSAEELQYIESRKLNREEVCMAYDVPPPVVHILDRATFSNITEQMRSMYRDTMAPHLGGLEATLDQQLRPDFDPSGDLYAEFLMDEVLRGDFETRVQAWATAIQTGQATPAEARASENRPFAFGSDQLFINAALIPIEEPSVREQPVTVADTPTVDLPPALPRAAIDAEADTKTLSRAMGVLRRVKSLADVDIVALGLNGATAAVVAELDQARAAGESVAEFRERVRKVLTGDVHAA